MSSVREQNTSARPEGVEVMYDLVKRSDVFVQSFRKGGAERLGLGYEDLSKHNSDVV